MERYWSLASWSPARAGLRFAYLVFSKNPVHYADYAIYATYAIHAIYATHATYATHAIYAIYAIHALYSANPQISNSAIQHIRSKLNHHKI